MIPRVHQPRTWVKPCHRVGTVANQAYVFAVSPPSPLLRRGPGRGRSSPRPTVRINGLSVRSEQEGEGVQREGLDIMMPHRARLI